MTAQMNKFLRESERKFFDEKQKYIREKLTFHLTDHLKENEYEFKTNNNEPLIYNECTSSLCFTIEAIFLHGLKDTFLQLLSSLGNDEDQKPSPSFWKFIQGFLHKQDIKEIQSLEQVKTEIGYCRVFVRKALNDSLLSSYLANIRKSPKSLKNFYNPFAFLFDSELSETAENLLRGIEALVIFNLPYNSSLLNSWQDNSLELSGLYTPALKSLPLPVGVDIVASLTNASTTANLDIPQQKLAHPDIFLPSISNSFLSKSSNSFTNDLDDDPKFAKLIRDIDTPETDDVSELMQQSTDEELTENQNVATPLTPDKPIGEPMQESQDEATPENENERRLGNLIDLRNNSWADPIQEKTEQPEEPLLKHSLSTRSSAIDNHSFESLWNEKQRKSSTNFQEVWSKFQKTLNEQQQNQSARDAIVEKDESLDFEVVKSPLNDQAKMNELQQMVEILCRLSTECGLDSQGFVCKGCRSPLIEISKATVCGFDGFYYCSGCISNDKFSIPARIIFNWDFLQYPVSTRAASFFADYQFKPFIDFKILNPDIYSYIDEMNKLQKLRIQLNFLRAYIFTCSEGTVAELQKLLYGKEYIYETIHLYSVADLYLIQNGILEDMLKRVVAFAREHCLKCILCKERGYHCEYCRKSKIIYPFDVDDVMRCNFCGSVSHLKCYNPSIPCPKCERKRRRQLNAALEAENEHN